MSELQGPMIPLKFGDVDKAPVVFEVGTADGSGMQVLGGAGDSGGESNPSPPDTQANEAAYDEAHPEIGKVTDPKADEAPAASEQADTTKTKADDQAADQPPAPSPTNHDASVEPDALQFDRDDLNGRARDDAAEPARAEEAAAPSAVDALPQDHDQAAATQSLDAAAEHEDVRAEPVDVEAEAASDQADTTKSKADDQAADQPPAPPTDRDASVEPGALQFDRDDHNGRATDGTAEPARAEEAASPRAVDALPQDHDQAAAARAQDLAAEPVDTSAESDASEVVDPGAADVSDQPSGAQAPDSQADADWVDEARRATGEQAPATAAKPDDAEFVEAKEVEGAARPDQLSAAEAARLADLEEIHDADIIEELPSGVATDAEAAEEVRDGDGTRDDRAATQAADDANARTASEEADTQRGDRRTPDELEAEQPVTHTNADETAVEEGPEAVDGAEAVEAEPAAARPGTSDVDVSDRVGAVSETDELDDARTAQDKAKEPEIEADHEDPMDPDDAVAAITKVLDESDPVKAAELRDTFWGRVLAGSELEEDLEGMGAEERGPVDSIAEPDVMDDGDDDPDLAKEKPKMTVVEAERRNHALDVQYHRLLELRDENGFAPDSIAARHYARQEDAILEQKAHLDSIINEDNPEKVAQNDAFLKQLAADRAAERAQVYGDPDDRYMRLTRQQLEHLRGVAVEEFSELDSRAAGSAARSDEILRSVHHIDQTLDKWREVQASKDPVRRALRLGREALTNVIDQSKDKASAHLDTNTDRLLRGIEREIRGMPIEAGDLVRRVAERRADQKGLKAKSRLGRVALDHIAAQRIVSRAKGLQQEARIRRIDELRREAVPKRRAAVNALHREGDQEIAEADALRPIRRKGNAPEGHKEQARPFGERRRPPDKSRQPGQAAPVSPRKEHKAAVRRLRAAQIKVRAARAQLNKQNVAKRAVANVPLIGQVLAQDTIIAQTHLAAAKMELTEAAAAARPGVPPIIGRFT